MGHPIIERAAPLSLGIPYYPDQLQQYTYDGHRSAESGYGNPAIAASYAVSAAAALVAEFGKTKPFKVAWCDGSTHILGWLTWVELNKISGVTADFHDARTYDRYGSLGGKRITASLHKEFLTSMYEGDIVTAHQPSVLVICEDAICSGRCGKSIVLEDGRLIDCCVTMYGAMEERGWAECYKMVIKLVGNGEGEYQTCQTSWGDLLDTTGDELDSTSLVDVAGHHVEREVTDAGA